MTFFAAVYGQEFGRVQASWVARARSERSAGWGRGQAARGWAGGATRSETESARLASGIGLAPAHPDERERQEEDAERWDGLS